MKTYLLALCAMTVACGGKFSEDVRRIATPFDEYDTAAGLVSKLGEPCTRTQEGGGEETWTYCVDTYHHEWFAVACAPDCAIQWKFVLLDGIVLRSEYPPGEGGP